MKYKWKTLQHNGVLFPPAYEPHNLPVIYKGEKVYLDILSEELATMYAKYTETEYIKSSIFKRNFWKSWKDTLGKNHTIKSLDDCDFSIIYKKILNDKEKQKSLSKEKKQEIKEYREKIEEKYKTAIIDGIEQPVGNYRIEPPGIFIGRGCHPKLGTVKRRIVPEDIIINIGKEAIVPKPPDNRKWAEVIHDKTVEWLASWYDTITGKPKYVWLGNQSKFKAYSDKNKFDLARKLKRIVGRIREINNDNLNHKMKEVRQAATEVYLIDNLALRIGNEKGTDEADTVGVTSLRVEHIKLLDNDRITLDFLGKDSIRYTKTIDVISPVYNNLKEFINSKSKRELIFDTINASQLNEYLGSFMNNLTAKVFRTYNASNLLQKELNRISKKYAEYSEDDKINILLDEFNKANAKVAILCNHQKKVAKNFNDQIKNIDQQIKKIQKMIKKTNSKNRQILLKNKLKKIKAKKKLKIELKSVSLETSKANYIDPRIVVAFTKRFDISIDKIYSKALQDKFWWALDTNPNFKF